jgi:hypothetical protein
MRPFIITGSVVGIINYHCRTDSEIAKIQKAFLETEGAAKVLGHTPSTLGFYRVAFG